MTKQQQTVIVCLLWVFSIPCWSNPHVQTQWRCVKETVGCWNIRSTHAATLPLLLTPHPWQSCRWREEMRLGARRLRDVITSVWEMRPSSGSVKRLPERELDGSPLIISKGLVIAQRSSYWMQKCSSGGEWRRWSLCSGLPQASLLSSPWSWESLTLPLSYGLGRKARFRGFITGSGIFSL